jgi:CheY-like chemotaxis protein
MARRHGASLEIESQKELGTTVRVLFPVSVQAPSPTVRVHALRSPARGLRMLIVDDDPLLIESLRNTLEEEGHEVTAADGGQAGIDAFKRAMANGEPFAVVITDLGMPYVDGRQVIEKIRELSPGTPIILLTGWGQRVPGDRSTLPNADRLLSKPPRLQELRAALSELTASC